MATISGRLGTVTGALSTIDADLKALDFSLSGKPLSILDGISKNLFTICLNTQQGPTFRPCAAAQPAPFARR